MCTHGVRNIVYTSSPLQQDLFDVDAGQIRKLKKLDAVVDLLNKRYGSETVVIGAQQYTKPHGEGKADVFADAIKQPVPMTIIALSFLEEFLWPCSVEVAEVGGVDDMHVRSQGVLGAVEVQVPIGRRRVGRKVCDDVTGEAVAAPYFERAAPVVSKRLLVAAGTRHGQYAGDAHKRRDDSL